MTDKLTKPTNQQPQAPDYGEPWHEIIWTSLSENGTDSRGQDIAARDGEQVAILHHAREPSFLHRIIACVNACAGIPSEELTPSRIKKGIALARALETDDPEVFLTMHEVALRRAGINKPLEGSLK